MSVYVLFFFELNGDHRDLHVLKHSFPTRRSSDLVDHERQAAGFFDGRGGNHEVVSSLSVDDAHVVAHPSRASRPSPARESRRSEEHTSELQSLMRISYAVFCLKKKKR